MRIKAAFTTILVTLCTMSCLAMFAMAEQQDIESEESSSVVEVDTSRPREGEEERSHGKLKYVVREGAAIITDLEGDPESVEVPEEVGGFPVVALSDYAFCFDTSLVSVEIPDSVTAIGNCAFGACDSLVSIEIPESVTTIDDSAFSGCDSLGSIRASPDNARYASIDGVLYDKVDKALLRYPPGRRSESFDVPAEILLIGSQAFDSCDSLVSIEIPSSVTAIGDSAFYGCGSLASVVIPESVTAIGDYAFYGCGSLVSVEIPDSVTVIGDHAFYDCDSLVLIQVDPDNTRYASIDEVLYDKVDKALLRYPPGKRGESFDVPMGILLIGNYAFGGCDSLVSVEIPDSVTAIGDYAFSGCGSLASVAIPESVTTIGNRAFGDSTELIVARGSLAAQWAKENDVPYTYPDSNDWLMS